MRENAIKFQKSSDGKYRFCWIGAGGKWLSSSVICPSRDVAEEEARRFCEENGYECDLFPRTWRDCD